MKVTIKTIANKTYEVEIEPTQTVANLKKLIQEKVQLEVQQINFIFRRKILRDDQVLGNINIQPNDYLVLHKQVNGANILEPRKHSSGKRDYDRKNGIKHGYSFNTEYQDSYGNGHFIEDYDSSNLEEELPSDQSDGYESDGTAVDEEYLQSLPPEGKDLYRIFHSHGGSEGEFRKIVENQKENWAEIRKIFRDTEEFADTEELNDPPNNAEKQPDPKQ